MRTRVLCDLRQLSPTFRPIAIHIAILFALTSLSCIVGSAQAVPQVPTGGQNTGGESIPQSSELTGQPKRQQPLPDAPSASSAMSGTPSTASLTLSDRFIIYRHALVRPYTIVGPAFGAAIGQWEDEPPEWGQGGQGYGRRFASGLGRSIISETIRFGVAAADNEDPRYVRSHETGVWNRTRYVIVATFTSQTGSGSRIPAYSRFAGVYGAAFVANAWYPDSRSTPGYALRRGSTALVSSLGFHLFEEFIPREYFEALHITN